MSKSKRRNKKNRIWRIERRAGVEAIRKARVCMNAVFDRYAETGKPLASYDAGTAKAREFGDKFGLTSELYGAVYDSVLGLFRLRPSIRAELERESKAIKEPGAKSSASGAPLTTREALLACALLTALTATGVAVGMWADVAKEWAAIPGAIAGCCWLVFLGARLYEELREG